MWGHQSFSAEETKRRTIYIDPTGKMSGNLECDPTEKRTQREWLRFCHNQHWIPSPSRPCNQVPTLKIASLVSFQSFFFNNKDHLQKRAFAGLGVRCTHHSRGKRVSWTEGEHTQPCCSVRGDRSWMIYSTINKTVLTSSKTLIFSKINDCIQMNALVLELLSGENDGSFEWVFPLSKPS